MAFIKTLIDGNDNVIYPQTMTKAVVDEQGKPISDELKQAIIPLTEDLHLNIQPLNLLRNRIYYVNGHTLYLPQGTEEVPLYDYLYSYFTIQNVPGGDIQFNFFNTTERVLDSIYYNNELKEWSLTASLYEAVGNKITELNKSMTDWKADFRYPSVSAVVKYTPVITTGTADLEAGVSALPTGEFYFMYE